MPEQAPLGVAITLIHLEEQGFQFWLPPQIDDATGPIGLTFSINARYDREPEMLYLMLTLQVRQATEHPDLADWAIGETGKPTTRPGTRPMIELVTLSVFETKGATALFDSDPLATGPAWPRFSADLRLTLLSTIYATCRGILFAHLSGTPLKQFVLPMVSPDTLAQLAGIGKASA